MGALSKQKAYPMIILGKKMKKYYETLQVDSQNVGFLFVGFYCNYTQDSKKRYVDVTLK